MSDIFENNDEFMPEPEVPASEQTVDATPLPADPDVDEFVSEVGQVDLGVDPNQIVTLRTSAGDSHYIAVDGPTSLRDLKIRSGLNYTPGVQFFLNNTVINDADMVPAGSTIVAIGSVKGG